MNTMDMNEMNRVRELLREPAPPSAEVSAKALSRLEDAMASDRGRLPRPASRTRPWSGWTFRIGVGLVAAGAAAAAVIVVTGQGSPGSPHAPSGVDLGRQAVLAAAQKAEAQPTGKYWYSDVISGQSYVVRAKSGAAYAIVGAHSELFGWHGVKPGMGEMYYDRDLPAHPLTPRDAALWRGDGAPSSFRVWSGDKHLSFTTRTTKWRSDGANVGLDPDGGGRFALGKSAQELQNLPADPAKLSEMFLDETKASEEKADMRKLAGRLKPQVLPNLKIRTVAALLGGPTPPKVRAGLIRALTAQKGVQAIGRVTDPLGRPGVALAGYSLPTTDNGEFGTPKSEQGTYRSRHMIVFDERTGALLAVENQLTEPGGAYKKMKPGFVIDYELTRSSGWTDSKPEPPAKQPF
ncbi:hypothetical protein ACQPZP_01685 [Spirillospora sp. CA-142024]|uniref:hypothetical protein n=1 Tax=Spirillospora sp. CA-142024 TaxID=3240036 RepID=UPI003D9053E9